MTSATWAALVLCATIALAALVLIARRMLPGDPTWDDERVLSAYVDAWDLSAGEIGEASRTRPGRLYPALARLESAGLLDSYWQGGSGAPYPRTRRYTLTESGRSRVYEIERSKIDDVVPPGDAP